MVPWEWETRGFDRFGEIPPELRQALRAARQARPGADHALPAP